MRHLAALICGDLLSFEIILDHSKFVGKSIRACERIWEEALGKSARSILVGRFTLHLFAKVVLMVLYHEMFSKVELVEYDDSQQKNQNGN